MVSALLEQLHLVGVSLLKSVGVFIERIQFYLELQHKKDRTTNFDLLTLPLENHIEFLFELASGTNILKLNMKIK